MHAVLKKRMVTRAVAIRLIHDSIQLSILRSRFDSIHDSNRDHDHIYIYITITFFYLLFSALRAIGLLMTVNLSYCLDL